MRGNFQKSMHESIPSDDIWFYFWAGGAYKRFCDIEKRLLKASKTETSQKILREPQSQFYGSVEGPHGK